MSIAVISTGTELLKGTVCNTNLAFLGRELESIGLCAASALTVGDRANDLYRALGDVFRSAETVIVSGGLGPTRDDLTLDAVCRFLGLELEEHPDLAAKVIEYWHRRHTGRVPKPVMRQARAPKGAALIANPNGSASGFLIETVYAGKMRSIFLLPGPPREFEPMVTAAVLPLLSRSDEMRSHEYTFGFLAAGEGEYQLQLRLEKALGTEPIELAYCATPAGTRVFVSGTCEESVRRAAELAREVAGANALPLGELELLPPLLAEIRRRNWTLVTAESCTGGMIANAITDIPGASEVFKGGAVVYSNELKHRLLDVPENIFREHGAVSAECAAAMVEGATARLGGECAIAVTGIAGPGGGSAEKPVGLVYIGVCAGALREVREFRFSGNRNCVRERARASALLLLRELLQKQ